MGLELYFYSDVEQFSTMETINVPRSTRVVYQPVQDLDSVKIQREDSTEDGRVRAPPSPEQDHITAKVTCASVSSGGIQR